MVRPLKGVSRLYEWIQDGLLRGDHKYIWWGSLLFLSRLPFIFIPHYISVGCFILTLA